MITKHLKILATNLNDHDTIKGISIIQADSVEGSAESAGMVEVGLVQLLQLLVELHRLFVKAGALFDELHATNLQHDPGGRAC